MMNTVSCEACYELVQKEELVDINGTLMCPVCADDYTECSNCGIMSTEVIDAEDGFICRECMDNEYGTCEECGRVVHLDNTYWFNDTLYCNYCHDEVIGFCEDCGCETMRDNLVDVGSNIYRWVCPSCVDEYHTCHECGDIVETLSNDSCMCESCYEQDSDHVEDILEGYSYKPAPKFFGSGQRFFGIELETEPRDDDGGDADMVREVKDYVHEWAYLKHDGSLCEGGFELVTHPMTMEHHLEKFTPELFKTIRDADYVSHTNGNCGLHIHISRTAFQSDLAIVKLLEFVYGNYNSVVSKLGRRGNYTRFCVKNVISRDPQGIDEVFEKNNRDRYHAINTQNRDTIELRFFRGTLVRDTFISALQFADVLINLANNIKDIDTKIEWADIFLEAAKLGYKELSKEIEKRLDLFFLEDKYEGYKLVEEVEINPIRLKEDEITTNPWRELVEIGWTREDLLEYSPKVLDEFSHNYISRYELDRHPASVQSGTIVQIMPLTMMEAMMSYGRYYPTEMNRFAGGIYKIVNCGDFYRLGDGSHYTWDRSSFRVLSEQEIIDRGL